MKPRTYILMLMLLTAMPVAAQRIVSLNLPANLCAGADTTASVNVSFGQRDTHTVVIQSQHTTLGHSERIFLPDGVPCNGRCTYRSPVTFNAFTPGATVTSVNDIKYVRLNMEHSFIGDLYIGIRCPNGTRATLMRFNGSSSPCRDTIPTSARGWLDGNNVGGYTFLGMPIDDEDADYECDSTRPHNAPGTGWNYCWSNNPNSGYSYASGDGIIYRQRNYRPRIDSSNVAAHTNYYHPDQNFDALLGCPLNGTWAIEVIDGYSGDNGYIFEWELSLDASLLPPMDCEPTGYRVEGPGVSPVNDSVFRLRVPGSVSSDTSVAYTFRVISSCGDTIDTTAHITVHPSPVVSEEAEACDQYVYKGVTHTADTTVVTTTATAAMCDSLHAMRIKVHPSYNTTLRDTIVENQLPYTLGGHRLTQAVGDSVIAASTAKGCDSVTHLALVVYPNVETTVDTTLCDSEAPFHWNGRTYSGSAVDTVTLTTIHGADSVVMFHLTILPTHDTTLYDTVVENALPYPFNGRNLTASTDTSITLANRHGCDSTVRLHLTVHRNHSYAYSDNICDDLLPYSLGGHTFGGAVDTTFTLADRHGADSTVSIRLAVNPTYHMETYDTVCDNQLPYLLAGQPIDTAGTTILHLATTRQCDSTLELHLTIHPTHTTTLTDEIVENDLPYTLAGISFGRSTDTTLLFANRYGCDSAVTLLLTVHPNRSYTYAESICDDQLPYTLGGHTFDAAVDTTLRLLDRHGADSTVHIRLAVHPTYDTTYADTTCDNEPYTVGGQPIDSEGLHDISLKTTHGCDSTIHLHLTIRPSHQVDIYDTICINTSYTFGDDTYSQSGDYAYPALNQYGCDSLTILHLGILAGNLKAKIHAIPTVATADRPHVTLYDQSTYVDHRLWAIGDQTSTERSLTYTFPGDVDSVEVHLTAYSVEGCSDTTTTMLHIDRATIYLPNAFTPTQETNRTWHPVHLQLTELEIWIYNRHGFLVRHLEGTDAQWDGTDENGTPMPQGAYVYNLTYRTLHAPNQLQRRTGTITLIR